MKEMFGQVIFILHSFNFLVQSDFHFLRLQSSRLILLSVRDGNESGNYFYIFINLFQFQTPSWFRSLQVSSQSGYLSELTARGRGGDSEVIR